MLACTTDDGKLPAFVMLKRKTMTKDKFPTSIIVRVQQKRWIRDLSRTGYARLGIVGRMVVSSDDGAC